LDNPAIEVVEQSDQMFGYLMRKQRLQTSEVVEKPIVVKDT
jgi:hypothetical protein